MYHRLDFFFSAHCPSCPAALRCLRQFASTRPDVIVVEHDVEVSASRELAKRYQLIATPALVIDGASVLYGVPHPDRVAARVDETTDHRVEG
jgi:thiol-disulfide isomerase/thioredoxin